MNRVRLFLFAVLAMSALGSFAVSSASAATSTSVLLLAGDSFPVKFSSLPADNPNNGIESELQSASGTLKGKGLSLQGELLTATGGLYEALFLLVKSGATECESEPKESAKGEVLVPRGNFTVVHDISSVLGKGVLFEVKEFTILCGLAKIKIRGNVLGLLTQPAEELKFEGSLECKLPASEMIEVGTPKETSYWTSLLGSELTAKLESNFGTGFKKACELIGTGGTKLTIDASKMIELMQ